MLNLCVKQQKTLSAEPFANGTNSNYVEDMYRSWQKDPNSVHSVSIKAKITIKFVYFLSQRCLLKCFMFTLDETL